MLFIKGRTGSLAALAAIMSTMGAVSIVAGQSTSAEKEQQQARQNEIQRRKEQEQADRLRRLKDRFVLQVEQSTDMLAKLAAANDAFTKRMNDLLTGDEGKPLVRDPLSFTSFLQIHEHPAVKADDIKARQKAATAIAELVKAEGKELDVGWLPSAETQQEATEIYVWVRDRTAQLEGQQAAIRTMLEKAPKIQDPSKAPTLAKAIEEYHARWYQLLAESRILGEQAAEKEARQIAVDASRLAKLEQAQAERDRILEETRTEIAKMKAAYQLELLQARKDAERKQFDAEKAYADARAELDRLRKDAAASRAAADTDADVKRNQILDQAKRKETIALLKSDEVQDLLAPFLAKGTWLPNQRDAAYEAGPMSLSQLARIGALRPTSEGVQKLMWVAHEKADKVRPRWPYGRFLSHLTPEQHEKVIQAQKYLIEFGNLMVEEGMLSK